MSLEGKNMLIVATDGWVVCGRIGKKVDIKSFQVHDTSVIEQTNGVSWHDLANGADRQRPTYAYWGTTFVFNIVLMKEWAGDLPPNSGQTAT